MNVNQETIAETTEQRAMQRREWWCDQFGRTTTGMAMLSQALFGGLLADQMMEEKNHVLSRAAVDAIMVLAGYLSKYYIVRYFNQRAFSIQFSDCFLGFFSIWSNAKIFTGLRK